MWYKIGFFMNYSLNIFTYKKNINKLLGTPSSSNVAGPRPALIGISIVYRR